MLRRRLAGVLVLLALVGAACSEGSNAAPDDTFGKCRARPGAICTDDDLRAVSLVAADLPKIDFSGSDLTNADFSDADLSGAKFIGSNVSGTDFTGANLTGADFSKALMFGTVLRNATIDGTTLAAEDMRCVVTMPDVSVERGLKCSAATATTVPQRSSPVIEYFRPAQPQVCVDDASGTSVAVEWSTRFVTSVTFFVDDIRISSESKRKGTKLLPFTCDGKPHPVSMQAVGLAPLATASFTLALPPA